MSAIVSCLGASNFNPGDTLVDIGCQYILRQIFPGCYFHYVRDVHAHLEGRHVIEQSDAFVLTGTPWFWHQMKDSPKVAKLQLLEKHTNAKYKIGLGVGSYYPTHSYPNKDECEFLKELLGKFDLVIVRDSLALEVLSQCGINCILLPCPSIYAANALSVKPNHQFRHLHIYCKHMAWSHQKELNESKQVAFMRDANRILTVYHDDYAQVKSYAEFDEKLKMTKSPRHILETIAAYRKVTSGRVHGAVPALSLGASVEVIPNDSRALTAKMLGATIVDGFEYAYKNEIRMSPFMPIGDYIKAIRNRLKI